MRRGFIWLALVAFSGPAWARPAAPEAVQWVQGVERRIARDWTRTFLSACATLLPAGHALNDERLQVTLRVGVDRTGALAEVRPAPGPYPAALAEAAVELVKASGPWPAPPEAALSDDGWAHTRWVFARDPAVAAKASTVREIWTAERLVPTLLARRQPRLALMRLALSLTVPDGRRLALSRQVATDLLLSLLPAAGHAGWEAAGYADDPRVGVVLLDALRTATGPQKAAIEAALGRRAGGPVDVEALARTLAAGPEAERVAAARALGAAARGQVGEATQALRGALEADSPAVRAAALQGLTVAGRAGAKAKSLFYRVIPLVKDPSPAVRGAAYEAMAATGGAKALADLLLLSRKAKHPAEQVGVVRALALLPDDEATARLAQIAQVEGPGRAEALLAWAGRDPEAVAAAGLKVPAARRADLLVTRFQGALRREGTAGAVRLFHQSVQAARGPAITARIIGAWLKATAEAPAAPITLSAAR
ncbi:MAG: HEAT repeat domain-containing protein [Myxococcales bacterium]|nr:HEAT repeat domain-containing protein [Myxococcales bacterium]